jgi:hypothetical protein
VAVNSKKRNKYRDEDAWDPAEQARALREEMFVEGLRGLESYLQLEGELEQEELEQEELEEGDDDQVVEQLAAAIERGERLEYKSIERHTEPKETAESFLSRLDTGFATFLDVLAGTLKVGHIMPKKSTDKTKGKTKVLTDVPEETSRLAPDIPEDVMASYLFGERVTYIVRRGFQSGLIVKPLQLLDSYGLLDDGIEMETQLCQETVVGKGAVLDHLATLDNHANHVKCSNLIASFPQMRSVSGPEGQCIAEVTCDVMIFLRVPGWYRSFLASMGDSYNPVSVKEQVNLGIKVPMSPYCSHLADAQGNEVTTISDLGEAYRLLNASEILELSWLKYPGEGLTKDDLLDNDNDNTAQYFNFITHDGQCEGREKRDSGEMGNCGDMDDWDLTPDEAETILRSLLEDDFDNLFSQLPDKLEGPLHVDPEYTEMFDESSREQNEIRLAMVLKFEVNLVEKTVYKLRLEYSWVNLGAVHERDVFALLHFLTCV